MNAKSEPANKQDDPLESSIPFWKAWETISKYQKDISDNLRRAVWGDGYERFLQLAPTNLTQSILPWSFSLVQITEEMKGNPTLEYKILTQVASYGSQLGTILDFLQVIQKHVDLKKLKDPDDIYKVGKFNDLVAKVNKAKEA